MKVRLFGLLGTLALVAAGSLPFTTPNSAEASGGIFGDCGWNRNYTNWGAGTTGDIVFVSPGGWGTAYGYWSHVAILNYSWGWLRGVEADPGGGVRAINVASQFDRCNDTRVGRVNGVSSSQRANAAYYAEAQRGKPYNWNWLWKYDTSRFYCSALVWRAYKQQGRELDPSWWDPAVSPTDLSRGVSWVAG